MCFKMMKKNQIRTLETVSRALNASRQKNIPAGTSLSGYRGGPFHHEGCSSPRTCWSQLWLLASGKCHPCETLASVHLHFLALPDSEKASETIPPSLAAEVRRWKRFMLSAPCSVLTNRKFPQSFHHRKFPVRKLLTAQTKSSSAPTETAEEAEAVWADGGGCE